MSVDWSALTFWFNVVVLLLNIGMAVIQWLGRKHSARKEELSELREEVRSVRARVSDAEKDLHYAPTQSDIKKLSEDLHQVNSSLQQLSGQFGGVKRAVDLINTHLLNGREGS